MHEQEPAATRTRDLATTPDELATLFQRYMTDGDLDGLVSLYEPEATFQPEPGRLVSGIDAIRESLGGYVDAKAQISLNLRAIRVVGDLALLSSSAEVQGLLPNGELLKATSTEVARRQLDGRWLYVIDDPFFDH